MLEKIKDNLSLTTTTATSMMSSKDEEYFLKYAQEIMTPLKEQYLNVVLAGKRLQHAGLGEKQQGRRRRKDGDS